MEYIPSKFNLLVKRKNKSYYVYNTQSGSLCCFDEPTYLFLKSKNKLKKEEIPYFDNLLSQGFIVDSNLNEFNKIIFNQTATIFNQNPSRMSFVITPTLNCNLRCKYCFEGNSNKNDGFNDFVMNDCFEFIKRQLLKYKNVKI